MPKSDSHPLSTGDFNLEGYLAFYANHAKSVRLKFIVESRPDLADKALELLASTFEANGNVTEFAELITGSHQPKLSKLGISENPAWLQSARTASNTNIGKLELRVREAADNHTAARAAYIGLGDEYYAIGEFARAKKDFYQHALEHGCHMDSDAAQYRDWCLRMVKASLNQLTTSGSVVSPNMNDHLSKARIGAAPAMSSALAAARGVSFLVQAGKGLRGGLGPAHDKTIENAAFSFLETTVDMAYDYDQLFVPQDIATYGGLCALAMLDRAQIKRKLFQCRSFKKMLSLTPPVEAIVNQFNEAQYSGMLDSMQQLQPMLAMDVYFAGVLNRVFDAIRTKAMVQFVSPYAVVRLSDMATIFQTAQPKLEEDLAELVLSGKVAARIDSRNGSLTASSQQIRTDAFDRALQAGAIVEDSLVKMLLTNSIIKDELIAADPRKLDRGRPMGGVGGMGMGDMMGGMMRGFGR